MTDEPKPLEWARKVEDTTQSIMRHVVMPAVMDRVDADLANLVTRSVMKLIEPETERQLVTMAQENALLRAIVQEVFRNQPPDELDFYLSSNVTLTADQLATIHRVMGVGL